MMTLETTVPALLPVFFKSQGYSPIALKVLVDGYSSMWIGRVLSLLKRPGVIVVDSFQ
jgi:hypothetical protein